MGDERQDRIAQLRVKLEASKGRPGLAQRAKAIEEEIAKLEAENGQAK